MVKDSSVSRFATNNTTTQNLDFFRINGVQNQALCSETFLRRTARLQTIKGFPRLKQKFDVVSHIYEQFENLNLAQKVSQKNTKIREEYK